MTEISFENLNALVSAGEKLKRLLTETLKFLNICDWSAAAKKKIFCR